MTSSYFQKGISMSIKQKYLKDENGEIFSPIVSSSSIYDVDGNKAPEIVAWGYISITNNAATVQAGKNITATVQQDAPKTIRIGFKKALKDKNYAAVASVEVNGTAGEIVGVYGHTTTYFNIDVSNHQGVSVIPSSISVIVIR